MNPYYEDEWVTIYHGDCREVDAWLSADVLVTDPPYGIRYRGVEGGGSRKGRRSGTNGEFAGVAIVEDTTTEARDDVLDKWGDRPALVFGSWKATRPHGTRTILTWEKGEHVGMGDLSLPWRPNTEEIYVLGSGFDGRRSTSVLRYNALSPNFTARSHPTQKPVELMRDLIAKCPPGVIADPFAGSGSTLRAAKDLGRRSIGIEIDEWYCEAAAKRLAQEVLDLGGVS